MNTSEAIYDLNKSGLRNSANVPYFDFKRTLTPRYGVVWFHIALGYLALATIGFFLVRFCELAPLPLQILSIFAGGLLFGYGIAFLVLFFHEAAHFNLAKSRQLSDRLSNLFIGWLVGQNTASYRVVHFGHHQSHGMVDDTEQSYFDPLNMEFIALSLLGVRSLKVLLQRRNQGGKKKEIRKEEPTAGRLQLLYGLGLHLIFLSVVLYTGHWPVAAAWVLGVGAFFPFFASVRQLLEHRDEHAASDVDYRATPHGRVNRLFGDGLLACTLGGAGFNRHLLHHFEPQVSYTRLAELETFLKDTEAAPLLEARQTTYVRALRQLFRFK